MIGSPGSTHRVAMERGSPGRRPTITTAAEV